MAASSCVTGPPARGALVCVCVLVVVVGGEVEGGTPYIVTVAKG